MTTPSLKAGILQLPASGQVNNAWMGIPGSGDQVLFANNDINNTWYLGFTNNITIGGINTIPVPPSGTVSLSAGRTVYAVATAGTTPLIVIPGGGSYFQGLTQGQGQLVLPSVRSPNFVHGVSGWTINKDGSVEFNNGTFRGTITGSVFRATNSFGATVMTINKLVGAWILYEDLGSATQGPVIASGSNAVSNSTDEFGNTILSGTVDYGGVSGAWTAVQKTAIAGTQGLAWWTSTAATQVSWVGGGTLIQPASSAMLLSANGFGISIGASDTLQLASGQGPFIPGETFHTIGLAANFTGSLRVKLLPWNAVFLSCSITYSASAAVTATFSNLPSASYAPANNTRIKLDTTVAPSAVSSDVRLFITPAGGIQCVVPTMSATGAVFEAYTMYPTN